MKIKELLNEGMYVVKSKDGVEKRFKDANSAEAKAWAESTRKKVKAEKYSQAWWEQKYSKYEWENDDAFPWSKISNEEVADQFDKIAKEQGFGRIEDWTVSGRTERKVEGVDTAIAVIRMTFSFGKEDDMGLDVEDGERISDAEYIKLRRDTKNPKKLVFMGYGQRVSEGEVVHAKFGKNRGVERDSGIEVPKGYDRFMVDGKKIIGIKGDKKTVVSSTSDERLARELVKAYNNGGKTDSNIKPISMIQAFGSPELAALDEAGIKLTEKPSYWEDFEEDGYAAKRNIHQVALKKVEKTIGKLKEYTSKEIYGIDLKAQKKGPLASYQHKPEEQMYIVKFQDGTKYLCDRTGASSYTRFWQKIA